MTVRTGSRREVGTPRESYVAIIKGFTLARGLQSNGLHPIQIDKWKKYLAERKDLAEAHFVQNLLKGLGWKQWADKPWTQTLVDLLTTENVKRKRYFGIIWFGQSKSDFARSSKKEYHGIGFEIASKSQVIIRANNQTNVFLKKIKDPDAVTIWEPP